MLGVLVPPTEVGFIRIRLKRTLKNIERLPISAVPNRVDAQLKIISNRPSSCVAD